MANEPPRFMCGHPKDRPRSDGGNISYNGGGYERCSTCERGRKLEKRLQLKMEQARKKEEVIEGQMNGLWRVKVEEDPKEWRGYHIAVARTLMQAGCTEPELRDLKKRVIQSCMGGWERPSKNADREKWQRLLDYIGNTWLGAVNYFFGDTIVPEDAPEEVDSGPAEKPATGRTAAGTDLERLLEVIDARLANPFGVYRPKHTNGTPKFTDEQWRKIITNECRQWIRTHWPNLSEEQKQKYASFKPTK